jgi:hypothetical protein
MVELYASWVPGLPENEQAVALIKNSPHITGVELSGGNADMTIARASGLKLSVHTPTREKTCCLWQPDFQKNIQPNLTQFDGSTLATFHTISTPTTVSQEEVIKNCINNLQFCCKTYGAHRVAFENTVIKPDKIPFFMTDNSFVKELLDKTESGLLFDVSHALTAAIHREMHTNQSFKEYLRELIDISKGRVLEMHFNVPAEVNGSITDVHGTYVPDEAISEAIIELARKVLTANPQIKVITLEMYTHTDPLRHAQIMCEQAEIITKKLGLTIEK